MAAPVITELGFTLPEAARGLAYRPGGTPMFAAVTYNRNFATSPDGDTWTLKTQIDDPGYQPVALVSLGARWAVFGNEGTEQKIYTTDDEGQTWVQRTVTGTMTRPFAWAASDYVSKAVAVFDSDSKVVTTGDGGLSWAVYSLPHNVQTFNEATGITFNPNGEFVIGNGFFFGDTLIHRSTDGVSWTQDITPDSNTVLVQDLGSHFNYVFIVSSIEAGPLGGPYLPFQPTPPSPGIEGAYRKAALDYFLDKRSFLLIRNNQPKVHLFESFPQGGGAWYSDLTIPSATSLQTLVAGVHPDGTKTRWIVTNNTSGVGRLYTVDHQPIPLPPSVFWTGFKRAVEV